MMVPLLLPLALGCTAPVEGDASALIRLTPTQWEHATADVLQLEEPSGLSGSFVPDPATGRFDNNAEELAIRSTLFQQLQSAAITLAQDLGDTHGRFERVTGVERGSLSTPGRRDAFLTTFGRRAFRRPLTPDEQQAYTQLFSRGSAVFPDEPAFDAGVQVAVVGFLQSPHFLYRVERRRDGEQALAPLSFASKLSFSLWNAPPDEELLFAAETAVRSDMLLDHVPRMLAAPQAREMVRDLHRQLYHVESFANIPREFVSYEDYSTTLNAAMQAEVDAFVEEVVFQGGTVEDLLTSRLTFVDAQIAEIYGIEGVEGEGEAVREPVLLDPEERAGLATLSGFLAVHSSEESENLIRRAAWLHESLLCTPLPPAPPDATALPLDDEEDLTTRERIEHHTAECGGACHDVLLNPIAFAFGQYDAMGRYRGDADIDASSVYEFTFGEAAFDGAVELSELLVEDEDVHRCYTSSLLSYLEGRTLTADDAAQVDALTAASMGGAPILSLIRAVVEEPGFQEPTR